MLCKVSKATKMLSKINLSVKALLLYRKCDGLVTSRGPDLHGRLEGERERERKREREREAMYYLLVNALFCYTVLPLYPWS